MTADLNSENPLPEESVLRQADELVKRITFWPKNEYITSQNLRNLSPLKRIRLSAVHFRDAAEKLRNAKYAFGQALHVREVHLGRSMSQHDEAATMADWQSRFYADYAAILIPSCSEHCIDALLDLYGLGEDFNAFKQKKTYKVKMAATFFEARFPKDAVTVALREYDAVEDRAKLFSYRNNWVHNKPPRVESILYNPPDIDGIPENELPWPMIILGYRVQADYTWLEITSVLQSTLLATCKLLEVSALLWEEEFNDTCKSFNWNDWSGSVSPEE